MVKELINTGNTVGIVRIKLIKSTGDSQESTYKNSIQPGAAEIVARSLLVQPGAVIDKVEAYDGGGTLLFARDISVKSYELTGGIPTARFQLTFLEADFNDTVVTLKLVSSQLPMVFSQLTGLNLPKDGTQQLAIDWSLIIN